jgi:hypothetical protein
VRAFARVSLFLLALTVAAGPVFAAPIVSPGVTLHAPDSAPASPLTSAAKWLALSAGVLGLTIRKDTGTLATKFVQRASAAAGDYKDGVAAAGAAWQQGAGAAEGTYEQGVTQAISNKQYAKGIAAAGSAKYTNNAVNLGSQRYAPGVANAKDAWAKGVQPALDTLKGLNLPPRGPRGSAQNQQRSAAVATALAAMRTGR